MLSVKIDGNYRELSNLRSCSREIRTDPVSTSQAFGLPSVEKSPVKFGDFIGDVTQGGSCNVNILSFTPHNLTHVETPAHIKADGKTLVDISPATFQGLSAMIDLSNEDFTDGYIYPDHLEMLKDFPQASILIIRTKYSDISQHYDFTGSDPISLHPSTTKYLTDRYSNIQLLVLDLPSADKEDDGGKLLAHRNFFNFQKEPTGMEKAIVELAYFKNVQDSGYYYLQATPARIDVDAIITDIMIFDVL